MRCLSGSNGERRTDPKRDRALPEALATATASGKVDGGDIGNLANALIARIRRGAGEVTSTRPYRFTTRQCERRPRTLPNGSGAEEPGQRSDDPVRVSWSCIGSRPGNQQAMSRRPRSPAPAPSSGLEAPRTSAALHSRFGWRGEANDLKRSIALGVAALAERW